MFLLWNFTRCNYYNSIVVRVCNARVCGVGRALNMVMNANEIIATGILGHSDATRRGHLLMLYRFNSITFFTILAFFIELVRYQTCAVRSRSPI